ncbi:hypothetical protein GIB67_030496 [Kingdonia uniflora]|uniref:Pentatricopeptide repeat-containing protein n=1 Tax=Kingdonia uniflora TaxID=39325 RepID=A0A7J7M2D4_9MAGN|nr:hypothetical protein GIB67_030496 [Kingdonia uniflora]
MYMKKVGVPPSVFFLNVFIKALCMKKETVDDVLWVFREIPDHGCIPNSYTYGTLINGLCKLRKNNEAKELFREMDAKGFSPTVVTYTSFIHGPCLLNILDEAMELLEEISRKGIEPNVVTFSSLMDGLCKGGRSLQALKLLEKMAGKRFSATIIIYNNLVSGLCKEGKVLDVVHILDRIKLQGLKPDGVLYGRLVNSLCSSSKFHEVANLLDEMVPGGMLPTHIRDVYKASHIINEMLLEGYIPEECIWNVVVCGFLHRTKTMKGVLFHVEEASVFNMKEQVFTKESKYKIMEFRIVHYDQEVTLWDCTCPLFVMMGLLLRMLENVNLLVKLVHLLLIEPGLPTTSQSIPALIVPEGFYSVIVDKVIREEACLYVEIRTLGDVSVGFKANPGKLFDISIFILDIEHEKSEREVDESISFEYFNEGIQIDLDQGFYLSRPQFFDLNSVGRVWNDNLIWVKGDCHQREDEEPMDLIYKTLKKGSELEIVLEEHEISRFKRANSRSEKVQKFQAKRKMTGTGTTMGDEGKAASDVEGRPKLVKVAPISLESNLMGATSSKLNQKFPKWKNVKVDGLNSATTESGE